MVIIAIRTVNKSSPLQHHEKCIGLEISSSDSWLGLIVALHWLQPLIYSSSSSAVGISLCGRLRCRVVVLWPQTKMLIRPEDSFTTHSSSLYLKHASMLTKNTSMSVIRDGLNIFYFYSGHFSFRLILSLGAVFISLQPEQEQQQ